MASDDRSLPPLWVAVWGGILALLGFGTAVLFIVIGVTLRTDGALAANVFITPVCAGFGVYGVSIVRRAVRELGGAARLRQLVLPLMLIALVTVAGGGTWIYLKRTNPRLARGLGMVSFVGALALGRWIGRRFAATPENPPPPNAPGTGSAD